MHFYLFCSFSLQSAFQLKFILILIITSKGNVQLLMSNKWAISLIGTVSASPHQTSSSHLFLYFFLLWDQKSLFLSFFIKPIPLIHFTVSSLRIQLHMVLTHSWWRALNITWGYVTHFCLISTHSSTKPTPRGRLFYVLSCTSKSFWLLCIECWSPLTPDQTYNKLFIADDYAVWLSGKSAACELIPPKQQQHFPSV